MPKPRHQIKLGFGGTAQQTYSTGGDFKQDAFAASVYAAYARGPWWTNAVLSAGIQQYDVNRQVVVGITVQPNSGRTTGTNYSVASVGGYDFSHGPLTHGPFAGIAVQQVYVNGFAENGSFTSLRFDNQTRNSAVGQIGYQVGWQAGPLRPFARVAWNRELISSEREVRAFLTTIAAPSYLMPAVILGRDWKSASIGTTFNVAKNVAGFIAFNGQLDQENVASYGGQVGINVAFGAINSQPERRQSTLQ